MPLSDRELKVEGTIAMKVSTLTEYFNGKTVLIKEKYEILERNIDKEIHYISIMQNELQKLVTPFWQISFNSNEIVINETKEETTNVCASCTKSGCYLL